jgi:hypothetical protein
MPVPDIMMQTVDMADSGTLIIRIRRCADRTYAARAYEIFIPGWGDLEAGRGVTIEEVLRNEFLRGDYITEEPPK